MTAFGCKKQFALVRLHQISAGATAVYSLPRAALARPKNMLMKIVTWNCNGAFRKKFDNISDFDADIYIIQECENPAEIGHSEYLNWAGNYLWMGDTKNKGLGIFTKTDIKIEKLDWTNNFQNHTVKHFLPCNAFPP